ncbi:hypothetical protein ACLOJK_003439 [Asimina triloba]
MSSLYSSGYTLRFPSYVMQHWFISRLDGASVTAGGFHPRNSNILVITTSSNRIYVFDVDAKQLGEWSRRHTPVLPRRFQEFPGEVIGISFPPSKSSTSVIVYSARAMCKIDFGMPVCLDEDLPNGSGHQSKEASNFSKAILKRKHKELDQKLMLNGEERQEFISSIVERITATKCAKISWLLYAHLSSGLL